MKPTRLINSLVLFGGLTVASFGAEPAPLDSHLEPLRPLLDKTWRGEFKNSMPDRPTVDIARWERALNGRAVRILHSINDGVYGGEIIVTWDEQKQQLAFVYFTTAGFHTTGTMEVGPHQFTTHETVSGSKDGITETRATNEIRPDGSFHVKSEYLKNGQWVPGHEATYREDPNAKVLFH